MAKLGIEDEVTTSEYPSFTTYERATKGSLVGIGVDSPMATPSAWVISLVETGLDGGTKASAGTPWAETAMAKAMASAMISAPSKKPSMGVLAVTKASSPVGR